MTRWGVRILGTTSGTTFRSAKDAMNHVEEYFRVAKSKIGLEWAFTSNEADKMKDNYLLTEDGEVFPLSENFLRELDGEVFCG